ncbi:MAG: hypothetical protein CFE24_15015 [Flavobacterium sp. BFFFF2]|nr:MAG: hypothetical protein CFE24_15015 [Flavobacterium sp. BFFFF2]
MELTEEQLFEKYGKVKMKFSYYYKYAFHFTGKKGKLDVFAMVGGNPDEIYRQQIVAGEKCPLEELDFNSVTIRDGEEILEEFIIKAM